MTIRKEIVYPIFLECCQFTDDTFWQNIFEDLAYGQTPYGTYITKDFLCCNYKNKEFSYKLDKKNAERLYNDIYDILRNKVGLLSGFDKKQKKVDFDALIEELKNSRVKWSNIRKKNIKDLLIENYCIEMKKRHNLDMKQTRYLMYLIFIGIVFKVIGVRDIEYEDGVILNINGISFKDGEIIQERDMYSTETTFRKVVIVEKKRMSDGWPKYIENLRKVKKA